MPAFSLFLDRILDDRDEDDFTTVIELAEPLQMSQPVVDGREAVRHYPVSIQDLALLLLT